MQSESTKRVLGLGFLGNLIILPLLLVACGKRPISNSRELNVDVKEGRDYPRHASGPSVTVGKVCSAPSLGSRRVVDLAQRHRGKSPLVAAHHDRLSSIRLPKSGFAASTGRNALTIDPDEHDDPLSSHSILGGSIWLETCDPAHPRAMLRDVSFYNTSLPKNLQVLDRNLQYYLDLCGGGFTLSVGGENRQVLRHDLQNAGEYCEIELSGFADQRRSDDDRDHVLQVMRGRYRGRFFEFQTIRYQVPEIDWPYLESILRVSARSFQAVW